MKDKKKEKNNESIIEEYDYLGKSCSSTDCTGLIPSAPTTEAELQSYQDLYQYTAPIIPKKED